MAASGLAGEAEAPGAPGAASHWASGSKEFLGTSMSSASKVYFTGAHGIVTEVFYPKVDCVQNVSLQFIVVDSAKSGGPQECEELRQKRHATRLLNPRAMLWQTETTADNGAWKISKKIFTDPGRNTLIVRSTFQTLQPGKTVRDYNVFVFNDPAIDNSGGGEQSGVNDNSHTVTAGARTMAVAWQAGAAASALAISLPWKTVGERSMLSNGFAGRSDGWTDLFGGACDKTMDWNYASALGGNVMQLGWIDFGARTDTSLSFDTVLGFGGSEAEAIGAATGTLDSNLDALEKTYTAQWTAYTDHLNRQGGTADDQYYLAAMSLKSIQDKASGAMIAGLGTPWGESNGDANKGGYHLVWARDLFKFACALIAAGDAASANQAVEYLFKVQMQRVNADGEPYSRIGRFPQNSFINGTPQWNATQMDEAAMPIVLAWKLNRVDLWPSVKLAADFLANNGPVTEQERWEEMAGYSPSTIAAEVAGLVCAASLAEAAGDSEAAAQYRRKADAWRNNVANWTFTTTGPHGDGKYYIRIDAKPEPDSPAQLKMGNGAGFHDQREIVDGGFLELVRMGVMSPHDWTILATLPEYDAVLKQSIPGKGDAWFRYNWDGYGESNEDRDYKETGRGRLWPIFTAERGIYEISASGAGATGGLYLKALKNFSTPSGFIPEQIWNVSASLTGWQTTTPTRYEPGTPTRSMCPLSWAMGEYINLLAAIQQGRNDAPDVVRQRYSTDKPQTTVTFTVKAEARPGEAIYLVGNDPLLSEWAAESGIKLSHRKDGTWGVTVSLPAATAFSYAYVKFADSNHPIWDQTARRTFRTPIVGEATQTDTFQMK